MPYILDEIVLQRTMGLASAKERTLSSVCLTSEIGGLLK